MKAKYFPRCDVLDAVAKPNSSYTWKSICGSLEIVRKGVRWRIGSGLDVDIWRDNWIPRDYLLRPITPDICEMGNIQVVALIDNVTNTWDLDMLNWLL